MYRIPSIRPVGAVTWNTHSFVLSRPSIEARGSPWPPCHTRTPPAGAGTYPTRSATVASKKRDSSASRERPHRRLNPCIEISPIWAWICPCSSPPTALPPPPNIRPPKRGMTPNVRRGGGRKTHKIISVRGLSSLDHVHLGIWITVSACRHANCCMLSSKFSSGRWASRRPGVAQPAVARTMCSRLLLYGRAAMNGDWRKRGRCSFAV